VLDSAESIAGPKTVVTFVAVMINLIGVDVGGKFKVAFGHGEPFCDRYWEFSEREL
jgi:hypothetical protein